MAVSPKQVPWSLRSLDEQPACNRMNETSASDTEVSLKASTHLLDTIRATREGVGDGLNDDELTRLLRGSAPPTEAGFSFLSYSDGFVVLTVPPQDLAKWYPKEGWVAAEKERIGRTIAEKYGLSLYEPVDAVSPYGDGAGPQRACRHHLELHQRRQTVIVAHPQFLKLCLFGRSPEHRYGWEPLRPLSLGRDLLQDLSALYRP